MTLFCLWNFTLRPELKKKKEIQFVSDKLLVYFIRGKSVEDELTKVKEHSWFIQLGEIQIQLQNKC